MFFYNFQDKIPVPYYQRFKGIYVSVKNLANDFVITGLERSILHLDGSRSWLVCSIIAKRPFNRKPNGIAQVMLHSLAAIN
jgi:hypothetical protein